MTGARGDGAEQRVAPALELRWFGGSIERLRDGLKHSATGLSSLGRLTVSVVPMLAPTPYANATPTLELTPPLTECDDCRQYELCYHTVGTVLPRPRRGRRGFMNDEQAPAELEGAQA